jgi:hypothetical protein
MCIQALLQGGKCMEASGNSSECLVVQVQVQRGLRRWIMSILIRMWAIQRCTLSSYAFMTILLPLDGLSIACVPKFTQDVVINVMRFAANN